jgi:hypothetical protein
VFDVARLVPLLGRCQVKAVPEQLLQGMRVSGIFLILIFFSPFGFGFFFFFGIWFWGFFFVLVNFLDSFFSLLWFFLCVGLVSD